MRKCKAISLSQKVLENGWPWLSSMNHRQSLRDWGDLGKWIDQVLLWGKWIISDYDDMYLWKVSRHACRHSSLCLGHRGVQLQVIQLSQPMTTVLKIHQKRWYSWYVCALQIYIIKPTFMPFLPWTGVIADVSSIQEFPEEH